MSFISVARLRPMVYSCLAVDVYSKTWSLSSPPIQRSRILGITFDLTPTLKVTEVLALSCYCYSYC